MGAMQKAGLSDRIRLRHISIPLFLTLLDTWGLWVIASLAADRSPEHYIECLALALSVAAVAFGAFFVALRSRTHWVWVVVGMILLGAGAWLLQIGLAADQYQRHWHSWHGHMLDFPGAGLMIRATTLLQCVFCFAYSALLIGPMLPRKVTPRMIRVAACLAIILLAIVGIGYISSVVTKTRCENYVAKWIIAKPMKGKPFYVRWADESSYVIFMRVGADFRESVTLPRPYGFKVLGWPEGEAVPGPGRSGGSAQVYGGHVIFPFIVSVDYEVSYGGEYEGGAIHFVCLFGLPVKIAKVVHEQS